MKVVLGPVAERGGTRYAVVSATRVTGRRIATGLGIVAAKSPLLVLFETGERRWAETISGERLTIEEAAARYPDACAAFARKGA